MENHLILGGDVSKGYCDFVLLDAQKNILEPRFRLDDNSEGHDRLCKELSRWKKQYGSTRILFVTESTGGYEDNWLRISQRSTVRGFLETYRMNPKIIHHEYQAQRRGSIDDGVSALTIAEHVAKNIEDFDPSSTDTDTLYKPARSVIRHIVSLHQASTRLKNALLKLMYQYLPSLEAIRPNEWPTYWLEMLARYGSRKSIQIAARKGFSQLKRVPKGKAQEVAQALAQGVDPRETPSMVVLTIQSQARQILQLAQEIKALEKQLIVAAPVAAEQVELMRSIKGMGAYSAVALLCFIEDVNRFDSAKQMAAFFGVQPRFKQSGDGQYKSKMSKQGASLVRRELYLLAFRCLSTDSYLKSIYANARAKNKAHDAALGMLMHKLIRIIFGILKNNNPYDPGVDQLNQKRRKNGRKKPKSTPKERRFQQASLNAPLSRKQRKQRKKDHEPQAVNLTESAGST